MCFILCSQVAEDLDHILWNCDLAQAAQSCFFEEFYLRLVRHRGCQEIIKEFLLHCPFREGGRFLQQFRVCIILWIFKGERNNRVFRGLGRSWSNIRALILFNITLSFVEAKLFCNNLLSLILLDSRPYLQVSSFFCELFFCMHLYSFILFTMKIWLFTTSTKKNKDHSYKEYVKPKKPLTNDQGESWSIGLLQSHFNKISCFM